MINFQTISFKGLNNTLQSLQANTQVQSNQVNSLGRSPMSDSVSFSGKRNKPLEDKIYDVEELEVVEAEPYIVSDDDVEVLDVEPDNYPEIIALDDQMRRQKEEQEEDDRRRQEQLDIQLNDDLIMYGVVMPELMEVYEAENPSIQTLDDAEDVLHDYNDFAQGLDEPDIDAGFDDFGGF